MLFTQSIFNLAGLVSDRDIQSDTGQSKGEGGHRGRLEAVSSASEDIWLFAQDFGELVLLVVRAVDVHGPVNLGLELHAAVVALVGVDFDVPGFDVVEDGGAVGEVHGADGAGEPAADGVGDGQPLKPVLLLARRHDAHVQKVRRRDCKD